MNCVQSCKKSILLTLPRTRVVTLNGNARYCPGREWLLPLLVLMIVPKKIESYCDHMNVKLSTDTLESLLKKMWHSHLKAIRTVALRFVAKKVWAAFRRLPFSAFDLRALKACESFVLANRLTAARTYSHNMFYTYSQCIVSTNGTLCKVNLVLIGTLV